MRFLSPSLFFRKSLGFTLIELLIVVSVIGVLSSVMVSVINVSKQKGIARDGIRQANVEKLVTALQAYGHAENNKFPPTADVSNPASVARTVYIQNWPEGLDDDGKLDEALWGYKYESSTPFKSFALYVANSGGKGCYKYHSDWGKIQDCSTCNFSTSCL